MLDLHDLPAVNASLNALAAAFLLAGWILVRRRRLDAHRACMIAAGAASLLFLASYLVYHAQVGSVRFQSQGPVRAAYFTILLTHTVLAAAIVPLVLLTLGHALKRRFDRHRRIARWTWPLWIYVSVTGIVVYFMLYHLDPSLTGRAAAESPGEIRITPDVIYGEGGDAARSFDVYRPARPNGAGVVFVNSGGFVPGQFRQHEAGAGGTRRFLPADSLHLAGQTEIIPLLAQFSFAPLLEAGFTVFDLRHGGGPDDRLPVIVADVHRATAFVAARAAEYGVDPERLGAWGASSGGYLALHAAFAGRGKPGIEPRFRAAAVYYPAGYDLASDARRFPELVANLPALQVDPSRLDSLSLRHVLSPDDPPCLIIYGTEDFPFITEPSESLQVGLERLGVPCRRIAIPGTGHEFRGPDGYQPEHAARASREMVAWFVEKLAG